MSLSRNVTGREFQRHGPATWKRPECKREFCPPFSPYGSHVSKFYFQTFWTHDPYG